MTELWGWFGGVLALVMGLCVGSFATVVIYRSPRVGMTVLRPMRSACPSCGNALTWHENIPLLSWFFLRGRCRHCDQSIGWRYPATELLMGVMFLALWCSESVNPSASLTHLAVGCWIATTCVMVSVIDIEHRIIPDAITLSGMGLGVVVSVIWPELHWDHPGYNAQSPVSGGLFAALAGGVAGAGSLWIVGRIGNVFLRQKMEEAGVEDSMGLGDVKWMGFAGTLLGAAYVLDAIMVACVTGAVVGVLLKLRLGRGAPVGLPFGPFLAVGILSEWLEPGLMWQVFRHFAGPA